MDTLVSKVGQEFFNIGGELNEYDGQKSTQSHRLDELHVSGPCARRSSSDVLEHVQPSRRDCSSDHVGHTISQTVSSMSFRRVAQCHREVRGSGDDLAIHLSPTRGSATH